MNTVQKIARSSLKDYYAIMDNRGNFVQNSTNQTGQVTSKRRNRGEVSCDRYVISRKGVPKLTIDSINVLMLMYSLAEIFYSFAFTTISCDWTYLVKIELLVDMFFMLDCILTFFTSYTNPVTGIEMRSHKEIGKHYLQRWFFLDFISSFPFDRVVCAISPQDRNQERIRLLTVLRFVKTLRFIKLLRIMARLDEELGHLFRNGVHYVTFFCLVSLFIHLCGCTWFATISYESCEIPATDPVVYFAPCGCDPDLGCQDWNWLLKYSGGTEIQYQLFMQNRSAYIVSLYYSLVTLTTLGYGDVTPSNATEQFIAALLTLAGAVMFSALIDAIGRLIMKRNFISRITEENVNVFSNACRFKSMGKKFDVLVRKQVHHFIIRAPHRLTELTSLPGRMQEEILNLVANDFLRQLDFFKGLDKDNHAKLAHLLKPCRFDPEEVVFRAKSIATEMYFVVSGKVSISVHADNLIWRRENPITFPDESNAELEGFECRESLVSTGGLFGEVELFPADLLDKKLHVSARASLPNTTLSECTRPGQRHDVSFWSLKRRTLKELLGQTCPTCTMQSLVVLSTARNRTHPSIHSTSGR